MREVAIVSTARTPIEKSYRGAFNDTQVLGGHADGRRRLNMGRQPAPGLESISLPGISIRIAAAPRTLLR